MLTHVWGLILMQRRRVRRVLSLNGVHGEDAMLRERGEKHLGLLIYKLTSWQVNKAFGLTKTFIS